MMSLISINKFCLFVDQLVSQGLQIPSTTLINHGRWQIKST